MKVDLLRFLSFFLKSSIMFFLRWGGSDASTYHGMEIVRLCLALLLMSVFLWTRIEICKLHSDMLSVILIKSTILHTINKLPLCLYLYNYTCYSISISIFKGYAIYLYINICTVTWSLPVHFFFIALVTAAMIVTVLFCSTCPLLSLRT